MTRAVQFTKRAKASSLVVILDVDGLVQGRVLLLDELAVLVPRPRVTVGVDGHVELDELLRVREIERKPFREYIEKLKAGEAEPTNDAMAKMWQPHLGKGKWPYQQGVDNPLTGTKEVNKARSC